MRVPIVTLGRRPGLQAVACTQLITLTVSVTYCMQGQRVLWQAAVADNGLAHAASAASRCAAAFGSGALALQPDPSPVLLPPTTPQIGSSDAVHRSGSPAAGGGPPPRQQQRSFPMPGEHFEACVAAAGRGGRGPAPAPPTPLPRRASPDQATHAAHWLRAAGCVGPEARRKGPGSSRRRSATTPAAAGRQRLPAAASAVQVPQRALRRAALQQVRAEEEQRQAGAELDNPESEAARKKAEADRLRAAEKFMTVRTGWSKWALDFRL